MYKAFVLIFSRVLMFRILKGSWRWLCDHYVMAVEVMFVSGASLLFSSFFSFLLCHWVLLYCLGVLLSFSSSNSERITSSFFRRAFSLLSLFCCCFFSVFFFPILSSFLLLLSLFFCTVNGCCLLIGQLLFFIYFAVV